MKRLALLLLLLVASCTLFGCPGDAPTPRGDQPVIPRDVAAPPPTFDGQKPPPADIGGPRDLTVDSTPPTPDAGGGKCASNEQGLSGKCYRVVSGFDMSYTSAKQACAQNGGAVVAIETSGEDAFVYSLLPQTTSAVWIGLIRQGAGFVWESSGAAAGYTNWASGEPNNSDGNEDCVVMWGPSLTFANLRAKWNDAPCSSTLRDAVVCER